MSNVLLIAKREYVERVRSKAFLFMTLFIPALMFAVTVLPTMLAMRVSGGTKHLVVAATDRQTAELIRQQMQKPPEDPAKNDGQGENKPIGSKYEVDLETDVSDAQRAALTEKVRTKQLDGVIWATDEALAANKVLFVTRDVTNLTDREILNRSLNRAVSRRNFQKKGLGESDIEAALKPVDMETVNPSSAGSSNPLSTFLAALAMAMIMYVTVLLYGTSVMRAVLEEKTSRIMEVMLSTATAKEMMAGKILGVGAVGLTQIAIWSTTTGLLSAGVGLAASGALKGFVSPRLAIYFPVFFFLGYAMYSAMYAAIGAMANSEQETQQLQFLVAMPLIASVVVLVQILQSPSTPLALWGSLFPLTAPLIMFTRVALDPTVPGWQIALSIGVVIATIYGLVVLCGRIYRIGILMYGKKPTLPEIMKWIRYA
jgi:ABC-2 type transport system permease protein